VYSLSSAPSLGITPGTWPHACPLSCGYARRRPPLGCFASPSVTAVYRESKREFLRIRNFSKAPGAHCRHLADMQAHPLAGDEILPGVEREQTAAPQVLRLGPTGRSLIRLRTDASGETIERACGKPPHPDGRAQRASAGGEQRTTLRRLSQAGRRVHNGQPWDSGTRSATCGHRAPPQQGRKRCHKPTMAREGAIKSNRHSGGGRHGGALCLGDDTPHQA
jgi:hypothetical protein